MIAALVGEHRPRSRRPPQTFVAEDNAAFKRRQAHEAAFQEAAAQKLAGQEAAAAEAAAEDAAAKVIVAEMEAARETAAAASLKSRAHAASVEGCTTAATGEALQIVRIDDLNWIPDEDSHVHCHRKSACHVTTDGRA